MTTEAFVGNVFLHRGKTGSPAEYERVCQVFSIGGLGATNALIDATTFCSGGSREYIGGLADGAEMTLELNYETARRVACSRSRASACRGLSTRPSMIATRSALASRSAARSR